VRKIGYLLFVLMLATVCFGGTTIQPNTDFLVRLEPPGINSRTAAKGDEIRAVVIEPADFAGYELVGHVSEAKSGGKIKGKSVLQFNFERLEKGTTVVPVIATLKQITNSKGAPNVDEEGRAIKKKSHVKSVLLASAGGALLGGLLGGGKGALIGAAAGGLAGAAAIELSAAKGADFDLAADSRLLVTLSPDRKKIEGTPNQ